MKALKAFIAFLKRGPVGDHQPKLDEFYYRLSGD